MKIQLTITTAIAALALIGTAEAGYEISPDKGKVIAPEERGLPMGNFTLGAKFSEDLSTGYLDSITPFWAPGDALFFLSTRTTLNGESQELGSYGLGFRYVFPDPEIIVGVNAFYDSISSRRGNEFDQLGLGVELLTRWFDVRANWYLNDDDVFVVDRFDRNRGGRNVGPVIQNGGLLQQQVVRTNRRTTFKSYEGALEGYNVEAGFLMPGLDRYLELRLLAGYYNLEGPFGRNFEGFKGRLEARLLPGVIADLEYWDDENVMGGHWTGGFRVVVPFSIFNLVTGRNPFEGTAEMFRPRQREFRERMTDMIMRSHLIRTTESDPRPDETRTSKDRTTVTVGVVAAPRARGAPAPTPPPKE
jgi:hypothetical protein